MRRGAARAQAARTMLRRACTILVSTLALPAGWAQAAPDHAAPHAHARSSRRVTLADALALVAAAPDVDASRVGAAALRAAASTSRGLGWRLGTAVGRVDDTLALDAEAAIALTPGRMGSLADATRAEAARVAAEGHATLAQRRADVARTWLVAWHAHAARALADDELAAARELRAAAGRARALGAGTLIDETAAEAYVADAELRQLDADGRIADATLDLAAALALPADVEVVPEGPLPSATPDGAVVSAEADAWRAVAAAERARGLAARRAGGAQLELGVRLEHRAEADAGFLTLSVQLPDGDRGHGDQATALTRATIADAVAAVADRRSQVDQDRARHDVEHAAALVAVGQRRVAALDAHVAALTRARQGGEALTPELAIARGALAQARAALLAAEVTHADACVRRALLAGAEVA